MAKRGRRARADRLKFTSSAPKSCGSIFFLPLPGGYAIHLTSPRFQVSVVNNAAYPLREDWQDSNA